jgi:hypothetical protein
VPVGLNHLDELPTLLAELVQLRLGARLRADAKDEVLEAPDGALVPSPPILLEPRALGPLLVRLQQCHRPEP